MPLKRHILPCLIAGLLAAFLLQVRPFSPNEPFRMSVRLQSDTEGRANLSWLSKNNTVWPDTISADVAKGEQVLSFRLPDTAYGLFGPPARPQDSMRSFLLKPLDRTGNVQISEVKITGPDGETLVTFPPQALMPIPKGLVLNESEGRVSIACVPSAGIVLEPRRPIALARISVPLEPVMAAVQLFGGSLVALLIIVLASRISTGTHERFVAGFAKFRDGFAARPRLAIFAAATLAMLLSCHPVVFFGKSFISQNYGPNQALYDDLPTMPQSPDEDMESSRGSDTGATAWAHLPYSVIQHRSVFRDGELPLWNRYTYCGLPLLGQGQSMLGDPLHWIPIAAGGAAWAWDVKFCIAKLLFSFGAGLLAFHATGRAWLSALLALSSSFIGFFAFRFNHCAFFSLCYSPWILLCWLRASRTDGRVWPWALALAAANFWELQSGTAKEAAMLIAGLNFTGGLLVLTAEGKWRVRLARLALMGLGMVIFVMLSAPHWMLFLDALKQAWTNYESPPVSQIQPGLLLGLFDDLFYSQNTEKETLYAPAANFLVLLGCLWAAANLQELWRERTFRAVLLGALPAAAMVFGIIPPALVAKLPFIGKILHVDNTFSCVLIIHLFVLAAFGLRSLWDDALQERARRGAAMAAVLLALLAAVFMGSIHAAHAAAGSEQVSKTIKLSGFFSGYAVVLCAAVLAMPWVVRRLRSGPSFGPFLIGGIALFIFHFRHSQWNGTKFDAYVANPRTRADLAAPSLAIRSLLASQDNESGPSRASGLGGVLVPGFNAVPGLEHFNGADAIINRWQREIIEKSRIPVVWGWRCAMMRGGFPRASVFGDLWNVRWYLGKTSELPRDVAGLRLIKTLDLDIYASPTAWPRAFFTDRLVETRSLENFIELLGTADGRPFAALVPEKPSTSQPASVESLAGRVITPAGSYHLTENSVSFTVNAPSAGVAVLGNSFEDGNWRVTLDEKPAEYFRVNHAFLGVRIPDAGTHILHFKYWPRLLTPSLWIALGGLLLAGATLVAGALLSHHSKK